MPRQYRIQYSRKSWKKSEFVLKNSQFTQSTQFTLKNVRKKYIILIFFPPNIFPSDLSRERGGQINLTILHIFSLLTDFHKLFRNINFISGTVNEWIVRDVEWCNIWLSDCVECKLHTAATAVLVTGRL